MIDITNPPPAINTIWFMIDITNPPPAINYEWSLIDAAYTPLDSIKLPSSLYQRVRIIEENLPSNTSTIAPTIFQSDQP